MFSKLARRVPQCSKATWTVQNKSARCNVAKARAVNNTIHKRGPQVAAASVSVPRQCRHLSTAGAAFEVQESPLYKKVAECVPVWREDFNDLKKTYGKATLGEVKVAQTLGGMRGIPGMWWETSLLDAEEGIEFRGFSIPELQEALPFAPDGNQPLPEGLLWLLLTGEIPTAADAASVSELLSAHSHVPQYAKDIINSYPKNMHPMTQLCSAVLTLQPRSTFAAAYLAGETNKTNMWTYTLHDSISLIAKLPAIASMIYRNVYHDGDQIKSDPKLDWSANFARMLGFGDNVDFKELMRLYLTIHADHEGGNVSAHTTRTVGSALSDPYLSYAAGMAGLAGPLHGLANQEVLRWLLKFRESLGTDNWTQDQIKQACWDTLNSGQVIPGYGHAVLRKTDPRYACQRGFALKHLPNDPMFKLVSDLYEVVPNVLTEHGKTANPWPNVDAHSGVLLQYYGLKEADYYTVLFGVSRAIGVLSQLVIDRAVGHPIERPKSITSKWIRQNVKLD